MLDSFRLGWDVSSLYCVPLPSPSSISFYTSNTHDDDDDDGYDDGKKCGRRRETKFRSIMSFAVRRALQRERKWQFSCF